MRSPSTRRLAMNVARTFALAFITYSSGCGGRAASVAPTPTPTYTAATSPAATASVSSSSSAPHDPTLDARVEAALARITRASYEADLVAIARPRNHVSAPQGLVEVGAYVEQALAAAGFQTSRQPVRFEGASADNVVAERAGSSDDVVVLTAHYDAVEGTAGADDNGSGVAALLAAARALEATPTKLTVRLVAFAFEEQGMIGSQHYVRSLTPAEQKKIRGVLNLEMIGYVDHRRRSQRYPRELTSILPRALLPSAGDFIGLLGLDTGPAPIEALTRARAYVPSLKVVGVPVPAELLASFPDLMRSDHAPFWLAKIPAVMMGDTAEFRTPHYHKASDTIATLDLEFATRVAKWAAAGALLLAEPSGR